MKHESWLEAMQCSLLNFITYHRINKIMANIVHYMRCPDTHTSEWDESNDDNVYRRRVYRIVRIAVSALISPHKRIYTYTVESSFLFPANLWNSHVTRAQHITFRLHSHISSISMQSVHRIAYTFVDFELVCVFVFRFFLCRTALGWSYLCFISPLSTQADHCI